MLHCLRVWYFVFFLTGLLTLLGCDLDPAIPTVNANDCYFPLPTGTGYDFIFDSVRYQSPYFNPNNPDEFVCLEDGTLIKYSISQNKKTVLFIPTSEISFQPKWSRKGYIAFNTLDHNIWVLKDSGDSLRQITNVMGDISVNYYGEFNFSGDSLMFHSVGTFEDGDFRKIRVAHNNFKNFDTIMSIDASPLTNWQLPGYFLDIFFNHVTTVEIANSSNYTSLFFSDTLQEGGVIWTSDQEFYCYRGDGIYKGSFSDNSLTRVNEMCPDTYYLFPSYSNITGKVISGKVVKTYLGSNQVRVQHQIVIMNPDGSNEEIILP